MIDSYPKTLSWNKSTDCCSWDGVNCDETTRQVIELSLTCSGLQGKFHFNSSLFQLSNLKRLDLSFNDFSGSLISPKFGEFSSLTHLDLSRSKFSGLIPAEISHLSKLYVLRIGDYHSYGIRLEPHNFEPLLKNLTQLRKLDLSNVNISSTIPLNFSPFLTTLDISNTQLFGILPERVFHLSDLESLDLSNNPQLIVRFPTTKWNSSTSLKYLYLDSVNFTGKIPESFSYLTSLQTLNMKSCNLSGPIPKPIPNLTSLTSLFLRRDNLSGQIDSFICNLKTLQVLDLGGNNLEGSIPQCLGEMSELSVLDLRNNSLSGTINTTFRIGNQLRVIHLDRNKLQGKVPPSLVNCKYLEHLDLGNNELIDTFPKWLGALPNLKILNLRSNKLHGPIKASKNKNLFTQLQIMDLSSNGFRGNLPASLFENFQAMKIIDENMTTPRYIGYGYGYNFHYGCVMTITTKGLVLDSVKILITNMIVDLSRNRFKGCIPSIVGDLIGLRTLNLSHNGLEGFIPASLHQLSVLESLDLSFNKIRGEIPQQLASLTSLAVLNLSHNHLVGCIPKGKQFDTFENSSYQGNKGLRGFPISKDCGGDDRIPQATTLFELDEGDSAIISWQAFLMGYGCGLIVVLSVIYIMLATQNPAWFSRMFEELEHKIIMRMQKHKIRN